MYINKGSIKIFSFFRNIMLFFFKWKWNQAGPCGTLLGTNPFHVPHFWFVENTLPSASLNFPKFQWADSKQLLSEGMQKQRRNNQETIMQQWSSVSVPPQGMYVTVSLSSSLRTKALHPGGDWAQESWNATILPQNPNLKKVYTQWKIRKTWPLPHMNNGD